jgi:hypothetical protein
MQRQLIPETTMHAFDKRFTDNDRDQQTYRSDPKKFQKLTIFFSQCKNTRGSA